MIRQRMENFSHKDFVYAGSRESALADNLEKIRSMAGFLRDWNGYGGQAFSDRALRKFAEVLKELYIQPQIAPTGRNSLLLQYEFADSGILAFELSEDALKRVCVPRGDFGLAKEETFTGDFAGRINDSINKMSCNFSPRMLG